MFNTLKRKRETEIEQQSPKKKSVRPEDYSTELGDDEFPELDENPSEFFTEESNSSEEEDQPFNKNQTPQKAQSTLTSPKTPIILNAPEKSTQPNSDRKIVELQPIPGAPFSTSDEQGPSTNLLLFPISPDTSNNIKKPTLQFILFSPTGSRLGLRLVDKDKIDSCDLAIDKNILNNPSSQPGKLTFGNQ